MTEELLTEVEHEALRVSGHLWHLLNLVVGDGRTRNADLDELIVPIHFIQRYVMANAAARAYPGECRLLGGSISKGPDQTKGENDAEVGGAGAGEADDERGAQGGPG